VRLNPSTHLRCIWICSVVGECNTLILGYKLSSLDAYQIQVLPFVGMKTVLEFFGIPEIDFEIFRPDSPVTVFFENGIDFRNFLSESVSKSVWCFTDRFLWLPVFVGNYRICVSDFSEIVSQIFSELCLGFFGIFQHVIFRIACTSLDKDYFFCIFLDTLRFFGIDSVGITIWSIERIHSFLCTCYVLVIYNEREPMVCLFHTLDFRVFP
jgi:hypothetical protein